MLSAIKTGSTFLTMGHILLCAALGSQQINTPKQGTNACK